jgi:predicted NUDIX family phosphoesterase
MDEMVLVVEDTDVNVVVQGYGLLKVPLDEVKDLVERRGFFVRRTRAEQDKSLRQLIPYVVIKDESGLYLMVKRLKAQTESRLHGFYSLGIGGHINDTDEGDSPWLKFLSGMEREVNEEVDIAMYDWPKYIGVIRENTTDVNMVHLGVVFTINTKVNDIKEKEKFTWELVDVDDIQKRYESLESWSRLAFEAIEKEER